MKKVVLTGGSHTGKTTLMRGLREILPPDVYFVPEPAALLIAEELHKQEVMQGYQPVLPTTNYLAFARAVVSKSLELEEDIPASASVVLLDRSLVDNIAYARVNGHPQLVGKLARVARTAGYTAAFLCDFVGEYALSDTRLEDRPYAQAIHDQMKSAYELVDVPVYEVPALEQDERIAFVASLIDTLPER